jgi:beta-glucosidase-like glycosyl hydrolase/CubicO group peptidase (beta-lactamase class C family)
MWASLTLKKLTLREKIAQLIQVRLQGKFLNRQDPDYQSIKELVLQTRVGGIVLFAGNVYESAILLNDLQTSSKLPLLVAADFERGAAFRISDTTSFPWAMALGAAGSDQLAYQEGAVTALESRALGVHWIYAPVMDVNNNPENPVINIRSFGEDPQLVARLGSAFIRGARAGGVLTTAKHFPGHGDTATDSHIGLPVVRANLARLESLELIPFRSAIAAGVDSIMTAHVSMPEFIAAPEMPATLSEKVLTDLLQNSLHFSGIVVTDALEMGAISNRYWSGLAAVKAIQAGADVLILPVNANAAIHEIELAVKRGDISEERINRSVLKILGAKSRLGLDKVRTTSIKTIASAIANPQSTKLAQETANRSITAVKDEQRLLPINPLDEKKILSLVLSTETETNPLNILQSELRRTFSSIRTMWGDARLSNELSAEIEQAAASSDLILCSTVTRLSSGQPAASFPQKHRDLIEKLLASKKPVIWTSFGNPYVYMLAPQTGTYICTFSYSDASQVAAAKALSGEIPIHGKMPVSIPPYLSYGTGLQIPRNEMTLKRSSSQIPAVLLEDAELVISSFIRSGAIPGAAIIVGQNNSIIWERYSGDSGFRKVDSKSIYALESLSAVVGSASAAMISAGSKDLILSAPIRDYLPELKSNDSADASIKDLLKPGDISNPLLLNQIISRASGRSMENLLAARLFAPLGMKTASFLPKGSGFLHSNANDLAIFAQTLLNGGMYNYKRILDRSFLLQFTGPQALVWSKPSATDWTKDLFSSGAFGHNSSTGSALWIDPEKKLFIVLLTNAPDPQKGAEVQKSILQTIVRICSAP